MRCVHFRAHLESAFEVGAGVDVEVAGETSRSNVGPDRASIVSDTTLVYDVMS